MMRHGDDRTINDGTLAPGAAVQMVRGMRARGGRVGFALGYCGGAIIAAALTPSPAEAQTTPAQAPAAAQAPATPRHAFSGSATVSASVETGRTDLSGVQLDLAGVRPYSSAGGIDLSFSFAHATTVPPGETRRVTVANRITGTFDVEHNYGKRRLMMLRAQALRDPVAKIRYRVAEMAGYGVRLENQRVKARVVPGVAFLTDDKQLVEDGFAVHYGLYEDITATITPAWSFTHYLSVSRNVSDPRDIIMALDAKLTGIVTRRLSIQLSYQYNYEKRLPPGVAPEYQKTAAGLQIRF